MNVKSVRAGELDRSAGAQGSHDGPRICGITPLAERVTQKRYLRSPPATSTPFLDARARRNPFKPDHRRSGLQSPDPMILDDLLRGLVFRGANRRKTVKILGEDVGWCGRGSGPVAGDKAVAVDQPVSAPCRKIIAAGGGTSLSVSTKRAFHRAGRDRCARRGGELAFGVLAPGGAPSPPSGFSAGMTPGEVSSRRSDHALLEHVQRNCPVRPGRLSSAGGAPSPRGDRLRLRFHQPGCILAAVKMPCLVQVHLELCWPGQRSLDQKPR